MDPICTALLEKILEQLDLTGDLLARLPQDALDWTPQVAPGVRPLWSARQLLPHLVESVEGFLAVLLRLRPAEMADVECYRGMPLPGTPGEVSARLVEHRHEIVAGFSLLTAADLATIVPTVFVHAGEPALTLMLGNLEHLVNHKQQLFTLLRLMGVAVGTGDLYRMRG
jgi:hypothetical protein